MQLLSTAVLHNRKTLALELLDLVQTPADLRSYLRLQSKVRHVL